MYHNMECYNHQLMMLMMLFLICSILLFIFPSYSKDNINDSNNYKNESYSSNHVLNKYAYSNFSRLLLVAGIILCIKII